MAPRIPSGLRLNGNNSALESEDIALPLTVVSVAFILPRVAAHVVAAVFPGFPEAGLVAVQELDAADPLGALPGIKARHHQPQRIAVVGIEVLAVVLPGEQAIVAEEII